VKTSFINQNNLAVGILALGLLLLCAASAVPTLARIDRSVRQEPEGSTVRAAQVGDS
jgi:hypothetical protein